MNLRCLHFVRSGNDFVWLCKDVESYLLRCFVVVLFFLFFFYGKTQEKMAMLCPVPDEFRCPLTNIIMKDPVCTHDGYTFERSAIETYFERDGLLSPVTGKKMNSSLLIPNRSLKEQIVKFHKKEKLSWIEYLMKENYKNCNDLKNSIFMFKSDHCMNLNGNSSSSNLSIGANRVDDMLNVLFEKYPMYQMCKYFEPSNMNRHGSGSIQNYITSGGGHGAFTNGINSPGAPAMNSGGSNVNIGNVHVNGSGSDGVPGFGDSHSVRSFSRQSQHSHHSRHSHNSHVSQSHSQPRVGNHPHRSSRDPIRSENGNQHDYVGHNGHGGSSVNFRNHGIGHGPPHSSEGRHGTSDENRYFMNEHENRNRNGISNENGLNDIRNGHRHPRGNVNSSMHRSFSDPSQLQGNDVSSMYGRPDVIAGRSSSYGYEEKQRSWDSYGYEHPQSQQHQHGHQHGHEHPHPHQAHQAHPAHKQMMHPYQMSHSHSHSQSHSHSHSPAVHESKMNVETNDLLVDGPPPALSGPPMGRSIGNVNGNGNGNVNGNEVNNNTTNGANNNGNFGNNGDDGSHGKNGKHSKSSRHGKHNIDENGTRLSKRKSHHGHSSGSSGSSSSSSGSSSHLHSHESHSQSHRSDRHGDRHGHRDSRESHSQSRSHRSHVSVSDVGNDDRSQRSQRTIPPMMNHERRYQGPSSSTAAPAAASSSGSSSQTVSLSQHNHHQQLRQQRQEMQQGRQRSSHSYGGGGGSSSGHSRHGHSRHHQQGGGMESLPRLGSNAFEKEGMNTNVNGVSMNGMKSKRSDNESWRSHR